jgi:DNA-binding winged helix-turn-helix (wHTH) protein
VALGRRAVALLCALVERPCALVSKDVLIEAAWPGQAVEDSNLTVQIAALRRVLGEATPGGDRWIETMPRHGYRFIGPPVVKPKRNKAQLEKKRTLGMKENLPLGPDAMTHYLDGLRKAGARMMWAGRDPFVTFETRRHVRYWPKAEILGCTAHVRFRGERVAKLFAALRASINRIEANGPLNQYCALAVDIESMLRGRALKIVLQHIRG